jgi:fluoride exporter
LKALCLIQVLAIAVGGALGAALRYWTSTGVHSLLGRAFPYDTLTVNVNGSLLIGLLTVVLLDRFDVSLEWRARILIAGWVRLPHFPRFLMRSSICWNRVI